MSSSWRDVAQVGENRLETRGKWPKYERRMRNELKLRKRGSSSGVATQAEEKRLKQRRSDTRKGLIDSSVEKNDSSEYEWAQAGG
ncbi:MULTISPECIES: hypothetical protein [Pontibacillus]|uniref:Uncharacterized protein n=1 Tax=Pontibacillus chungwhensis TaxID=265426 RepID=A0ABY8V1E7_9BACI|nr:MULTISPECIES: hypothetical protein [Pontibacillus]WIF98821.1 hypothetical protein QNI29_03975 [Pontibacillus chungwhensis]